MLIPSIYKLTKTWELLNITEQDRRLSLQLEYYATNGKANVNDEWKKSKHTST